MKERLSNIETQVSQLIKNSSANEELYQRRYENTTEMISDNYYKRIILNILGQRTHFICGMYYTICIVCLQISSYFFNMTTSTFSRPSKNYF